MFERDTNSQVKVLQGTQVTSVGFISGPVCQRQVAWAGTSNYIFFSLHIGMVYVQFAPFDFPGEIMV